VSASVARLIAGERETRDVVIAAARAGEYIQVRVSARSVDRYMKLTEAEARQLRDVVAAALEGGSDG
jgi:hypothetical protein